MTQHFTTELRFSSGFRALGAGWHVQLVSGPAPSGIAGCLIPITVPGTIHEDLEVAGLPAEESAEAPAGWVAQCHWEYCLDFPWHRRDSTAELLFTGLTEGASVQLNGRTLSPSLRGEHLGQDVGTVLFDGINTLRVAVPPCPASETMAAEQLVTVTRAP